MKIKNYYGKDLPRSFNPLALNSFLAQEDNFLFELEATNLNCLASNPLQFTFVNWALNRFSIFLTIPNKEKYTLSIFWFAKDKQEVIKDG